MTGTLPLIVHEFSPATIGGVEVWTDLTNRWHSPCTIDRGKQYERGQSQAGTMSTAYRNNDGYLTPGYSSSPFSGGVVLYAPIRVRAQYPATPNLLDGDLATSGQTSPISPGPIPASLNMASDVGATLSIAASASAFEGGQVFQASVPASVSSGFYILKSGYIPVQATSAQAPATEYTWSTRIRCTSPGNNPQMAAAVKWYNASGGVVSANTGSTVTLTGSATAAWTQVSVTASVPTGAVCARLAVAVEGTPPSSAWTYQQDGSQWQIGPFSAWTAPGEWFYLFSGVVERWPQAWVEDPSGNYTVAQVKATDCLSQMGRQKLNYCYLEYLLPLGPRWLFQLDENSNGFTPVSTQSTGYVSMVWADTMGLHNPIPAWSGNWAVASVTPGVSPVSNTAAGAFAGTPGPVLECNNAGANPYSSILSVDNTNSSNIGPPQGTGWSVICAFLAVPQTGGTQFNDLFMWSADRDGTGAHDNATLAITNVGTGGSGFPYLIVQNNAGTQVVTPNTSSSFGDGNWHLCCGTLSADGKTVTIMVDGQSASASSGTSFSTGQSYFHEAIGGASTGGAPWCGYLSQVCQIPYPITQAQFNTLYGAWRGAFAGESTGARIARILEVAGLDFSTSIQAGSTGMGAAGDWSSSTVGLPFQGQSVQALCQQAVDAEQGQMWASVENEFTFTGRTYRSPNPDPRLLTTFGEKADGWLLGSASRSVLGQTTVLQGEIPYTLPAQIGYDADQAYTVAQITMYNGLPPVAGTAGSTITIENTAAVNGPLGVQLYSANLNIFNAAGTTKVAQWIVDNGSVEDLRVQSLTVDLSGFSPTVAANAWPQVLGTDINTCTAVNRRPLGGAPLALTQWIEKITWNLDPDKPSAKVTYQMSPASKSLG